MGVGCTALRLTLLDRCAQRAQLCGHGHGDLGTERRLEAGQREDGVRPERLAKAGVVKSRRQNRVRITLHVSESQPQKSRNIINGVIIGITVAVLIALFELGSNRAESIAQERYIGEISAFFICEIRNVPKRPGFVTKERTPQFRRHMESIQYREYLRMMEEILSALEHNSSEVHFLKKRNIQGAFYDDELVMIPTQNTIGTFLLNLERVVLLLNRSNLKGFHLKSLEGCDACYPTEPTNSKLPSYCRDL